jgi:hypothetical protein
MTNAISAFTASGVEIAHIMLGANDAENGVKFSTGVYKSNMENIIETLKDAGMKKIILSYPTYIVIPSSIRDQESLALIIAYQEVIDELVDGETVLLGDVEAFDYFSGHQNELPDKVHPNGEGYQNLGKFRATAIKSAIDYQITPEKHFVDEMSGHTLTTTGTLTLSIDKYFGEFSNVVEVDGNPLSSGYTATSGSTEITLEADYLNTLSTGSHTLSVGFEG